jgi:hypothetical protein
LRDEYLASFCTWGGAEGIRDEKFQVMKASGIDIREKQFPFAASYPGYNYNNADEANHATLSRPAAQPSKALFVGSTSDAYLRNTHIVSHGTEPLVPRMLDAVK